MTTPLLSRVAGNLYWAARYLERAEDTSRLVRAFTEVIVDLPVSSETSWDPLLAMVGDLSLLGAGLDETAIISRLLVDGGSAGSVVSSVAAARENLRTTREVMPREAWETVNDLYLYTVGDSAAAVRRPARTRFCQRVVHDVQHLDGILTSSWSRDAAYEVWRLGEAIERTDMTTRVIGVRAVALMGQHAAGDHADVQWMGLLRALSALQMYRRAVRQPVEASHVLPFLLGYRPFPRSVAHCVGRVREAVERLPHCELILPSVEALERVAADVHHDVTSAGVSELDGYGLDAAMDRLQVALTDVDDVVNRVLFGWVS